MSLLILGTLATLMGARQVLRSENQQSRQAFVASAAQIASTLKLAILHEQDLVENADALFVRNPANVTETQFLQWTASVAAFHRYPELQGISELQMVPASQLAAIAAREQLDPPGPLAPNGTYQVSPPGYRPYYCLATVSQSRNPKLALPAGTDFCRTSLGAQFLKSRDSGLTLYIPYKTGSTEELGLGTAIYQGGSVPKTVAARRASLIGWTGIEFTPGVVLSAALAGHSSTDVLLRYEGSSHVTFKAGSVPRPSQTTSIELHNGWQVQVIGTARGGTLFSNGTALALLLGGVGFFLLLGALIYALGTGRSRALLMVEERTSELRHQAFHDALTGLPNRALILDRIGQMLLHVRREGGLVAAFFVDLDNFKDINDTLGHRAGDELLVGVGQRLTGLLRERDSVGRLGGDEFIVLTESIGGPEEAEIVADRILRSLETPFEISGSHSALPVTASIGIAVGRQVAPEEMLRDADIALYQAKAAGKHCAKVFAEPMKRSLDERHTMDVELHHAVDADEFFVLYQPTVSLCTGAVVGVEALLRWRHPTRGVLSPSEFIPALEASGLILPVGKRVIEVACRAGARWNELGHRVVVSVNVSPRQLQRDRIVDDVYGALSSSGLDPSLLVLELTETSLIGGVDEIAIRLMLLKGLGVRLAIDDFGTGFSSLAYLQQFPIDVLKIDQSFVSGLADTGKSGPIIRTFVQLGKALGLEVVAEGIETDHQRDQLAVLGVDTGQGYLFSYPVEDDAIAILLHDRALPAETVGAVHLG